MPTNQKITNETINFEEVIHEKVKALIDKKYKENKESVDRLGTIVDSWRNLNESLFNEITTRTDQVKKDKEAVLFTKSLLTEIQPPVSSENAFVIYGKIVDKKSEVGIPGMSVTILAPPDMGIEAPIRTGVQTDAYGNFAVYLAEGELEQTCTDKVKLTFQVFLPSGKFVYSKDVSMQPVLGRSIQFLLKIKSQDEEVKKHLEAATAQLNSVEGDEELVTECNENIEEAHANLNKIKDISHDEIKTLRDDLGVEPPVISLEYEEEFDGEEEGEEALETGTGEQVQTGEVQTGEKQKQKD